MPPPVIKIFRDANMEEEIPYVGFGEDPVEMGETGTSEAYVVNMSKRGFEYVVTELNHENPYAVVNLEQNVLPAKTPIKVTVTWTPPFSENEEDWEPLTGNIRMNGHYVII